MTEYTGRKPQKQELHKKSKPSLGLLEIQRRSKLHAILRDVGTVIAAWSPERRPTVVERITPLVVDLVTEIAVLDRETDASDPRVMAVYGGLIAECLGIEDEPWMALGTWKRTAPGHLARAAEAWAQHLFRANRNSESRHHHVKLVEEVTLANELNLTRPRIREIFGKPTCALKPIRMHDPEFSKEEHRLIRELAQRIGWTTRRIRDRALECYCDPETFTQDMWRFEVNILPETQISGHRIAHASDVQTSKWVRRTGGKPGPKRRKDTITRQIQAVAEWRGVGTRSIERLRQRRTDELLEAYGSDSFDVTMHLNSSTEKVTFSASDAVPMTVKSCPDDGEFPHSEKVTCSACFPYENSDETRTVKGVTITDTILIEIVDEGRFSGRRKRWSYTERETVEAWYLATEGRSLSAETRKKWAQRDLYRGKLETARRWKREMEIREREDSEATSVTYPKIMVESPPDRSLQTKRSADPDYVEEASDSLRAIDAWMPPDEEYDHADADDAETV